MEEMHRTRYGGRSTERKIRPFSECMALPASLCFPPTQKLPDLVLLGLYRPSLVGMVNLIISLFEEFNLQPLSLLGDQEMGKSSSYLITWLVPHDN